MNSGPTNDSEVNEAMGEDEEEADDDEYQPELDDPIQRPIGQEEGRKEIEEAEEKEEEDKSQTSLDSFS